jgi:hypothetical protein
MRLQTQRGCVYNPQGHSISHWSHRWPPQYTVGHEPSIHIARCGGTHRRHQKSNRRYSRQLYKGDDNVRGHIGTELSNNAETVLVLNKSHQDSAISEVRPLIIRDKEFKPFAFRVV